MELHRAPVRRNMVLAYHRDRPVSSVSAPRSHFDVHTGQVFVERNVSASSIQCKMRLASSRLNRLSCSRDGVGGCATLGSMALREILRNINGVDSDVLEHVPWQVAKQIWEEADRMELTTTTLWRTFATVYPEEERFRYHRSSEVVLTRCLSEYLSDLNSDTFQWLTCLTLSNVALPRADVINISNLCNVVALDICGSDSTPGSKDLVDDSVIRNWARRAQESPTTFSLLSVLILRNQPGVTARCMEHLSAFPSMSLYGVRGCRVDQKDAAFGWSSVDDHGILTEIQKDIETQHAWDDALRSCFQRSVALLPSSGGAAQAYNATMRPNTQSSTLDIPLLSFRLGHTSSEVLYSYPLIFFRCLLRNGSCCESAVLQSLRNCKLSAKPAADQAESSLTKKRKLRRTVDLGGLLEVVESDGLYKVIPILPAEFLKTSKE